MSQIEPAAAGLVRGSGIKRSNILGFDVGFDLAVLIRKTPHNAALRYEETSLMMATWHPDQDATPTPKDVEFMAATLEGRHGTHAAGVAEFFSTLHGNHGDAGRSWAWAGVAELVRKREQDRIGI